MTLSLSFKRRNYYVSTTTYFTMKRTEPPLYIWLHTSQNNHKQPNIPLSLHTQHDNHNSVNQPENVTTNDQQTTLPLCGVSPQPSSSQLHKNSSKRDNPIPTRNSPKIFPQVHQLKNNFSVYLNTFRLVFSFKLGNTTKSTSLYLLSNKPAMNST